jgi:hypothetical protein
VKILIRKTYRHGRSNDGNHFNSPPQVGHECVRVVENNPGTVRAGSDTGTASDTHIGIETDVSFVGFLVLCGTVIAEVHRTLADTFVTVDAFCMVNFNDMG